MGAVKSGTGMEEGFLEAGGGKVWFGIAGAGKPGVPLLTLHGGPGVPHDYLEPLAELAADRPVVFWDQPGCGKSDRPDAGSTWTAVRLAAATDAVRKALGLGRMHLLGQSWGAYLALEYLSAFGQDGVASLTLAGPLVDVPRWIADQRQLLEGLPPDLRQAALDGEASGDFSGAGYAAAIQAYYRRHVCRADPWPECLDRALAGMGQEVYLGMWGPSEFTCTGNLRGGSRADVLPRLRVPMLFTCGEFDEARPATVAAFRDMAPGADLAVFGGASHMHHLERSDDFLAVLARHLARAERMA